MKKNIIETEVAIKIGDGNVHNSIFLRNMELVSSDLPFILTKGLLALISENYANINMKDFVDILISINPSHVPIISDYSKNYYTKRVKDMLFSLVSSNDVTAKYDGSVTRKCKYTVTEGGKEENYCTCCAEPFMTMILHYTYMKISQYVVVSDADDFLIRIEFSIYFNNNVNEIEI